jgi:hypothetical protein
MVLVSRRSVDSVTQKLINILEKSPGWKIKNGLSVKAKCGEWHPKRYSVSSGRVQGCSQKRRQRAGEMSRVASKKGHQFPRELSRVAEKILIRVQAIFRG